MTIRLNPLGEAWLCVWLDGCTSRIIVVPSNPNRDVRVQKCIYCRIYSIHCIFISTFVFCSHRFHAKHVTTWASQPYLHVPIVLNFFSISFRTCRFLRWRWLRKALFSPTDIFARFFPCVIEMRNGNAFSPVLFTLPVQLALPLLFASPVHTIFMLL